MRNYEKTWDFEPEPHWTDNFSLNKEQRRRLKDMYRDFLEEAACEFGLNTSEWDSDEWDIWDEVLYDNRF